MSGSPFPGMDPYLEGEMWQEFHDTLAHQIRGQLLPLLQPKYVALLSKRYVVDDPTLEIADAPQKREMFPDVHGVKEAAVAPSFAVEMAITPIELISPMPKKVPVLSIEIRDIARRRLVTAIEILSPVNKRGRGFRDYSRKRTALLQTKTHLLEIDLLRGGARIPLIGELPRAAYYVFLSRFTRRPRTEAWPVQLRDSLPTIPVPLLAPDPDPSTARSGQAVPLNLQAAVHACFELVGYERLLDYSQRPPPPELSAEDLQWAQAQIKILVAE